MQNYSQTARDDQGAIELLFGQCRILVDGSELITYSVQGETFVRHVGGKLHFVVNGGDYNADTPEELATILREEYEDDTIHPAAFSLANDAYFIASGVAAPSMTARSVSSSEGAGSSSGGAGAASGKRKVEVLDMEDFPNFVYDGERDEDGGLIREAENGDLFYEMENRHLVRLEEKHITEVDGIVYVEVLGSLKEFGLVSERDKRRKTDGGDGGSGH